MKRILSIALFAFLLCACGNKTLLDENRTFANDTWMRFTPEHFDVPVSNTETATISMSPSSSTLPSTTKLLFLS